MFANVNKKDGLSMTWSVVSFDLATTGRGRALRNDKLVSQFRRFDGLFPLLRTAIHLKTRYLWRYH